MCPFRGRRPCPLLERATSDIDGDQRMRALVRVDAHRDFPSCIPRTSMRTTITNAQRRSGNTFQWKSRQAPYEVTPGRC
jgi:hypothetical protein